MPDEIISYMPMLLDALRSLGGSASTNDVYDWMANKLQLSPDERYRRDPNGNIRFQNRVQWARQHLVRNGLIDGSRRGVWTLTPEGAKAQLTLEQSQELAAKSRSAAQIRRPRNQPQTVHQPELEENSAPPEQAEENSLIAVLQSLPPSGFERLCKRLLHECGFERVEVTGRAHDGGIDGHGILRVNPLYALKVIFQCKRYQGAVSRAQVGDFRNAMLGRADKGILITTGYFSPDAEREASREGVPPIELVDGDRLVELFELKQLGLRRKEIFEVDLSFFDQFR